MANNQLIVKIYAERNGRYENSYMSRIYENPIDAKLQFDRLVALVIKLAIVKQKHLSKYSTYDYSKQHCKFASINFDYITLIGSPMKEKVSIWIDTTENQPSEEEDFKGFLYDEADRLFDKFIAAEEEEALKMDV